MNSECPADEDLLALATDEECSSELREHVEQCADCREKVKQIVGEVAELRAISGTLIVPTNHITEKPQATDHLTTGTVIGRYCVVGTLGSGGQADVYRVVDSELERFLVLKLSRKPSETRPGHRDAILAEGRLLADLDHPGLVRIFDVGFSDGRPYLVLEHVPGRNLEQTFSSKNPTFNEAARLMMAVANVVAYAHQHGITHGDITPRNILIDREGHPRLIDFGLSKIEDAWNEESGPNGGTPEFLPPETAPVEGKMGRSDPASDVFGLGATLFWLLTGIPPFAAATIDESLERSRRCDIDFDTLEWARVPGGIARICKQALAANPVERPTPEAFATALDQATRRWITPITLGVIVAVILIVGGLTWWADNARDQSRTDTGSVIHSVPTVNIFRGESVRTLSNEIPLNTGDRISVSCNLSPGLEAVILWFTAAGELKILKPERDIADKVDRLVYPGPRRPMVLEAPEGTELIFCCRGEMPDSDLSTYFPIGKPLPTIPANNWLVLQHSAVRIEGILQSDVTDELFQLEQVMKEIDRGLRRHFPGVTAIAFPHLPATSAK